MRSEQESRLPDSSDLFAQYERDHVQALAGRTLIVGSKLFGNRPDRRLRYADAIGVDMQAGDGVDRVLDLEDDLPDDIGQFAHIECCSVMEHSRRPWLMAANIERLLVPGGTLLLSVPFVWRSHQYPGDLFRFTDEGVRSLFPNIEWASLQYASTKLSESPKLKAITGGDGHPYFPRTEVFGFGAKK